MRQIDVEIEITKNPSISFTFLISGEVRNIKFWYSDVNPDDVTISIEAQTELNKMNFETIWTLDDGFPFTLPVGRQWYFVISGATSGSIIAKLEIES